MNERLFSRLALVLLLGLIVVLAFTKIIDPDAWIHLSMGRLLAETRGIPQHEMFTFPSADLPFSYGSWLFGLMSYLIHAAFGGFGLVLFKTGVVALAFTLVFRDSLRPHRNYPVAIVLTTAALLFSQDRFMLRPEIVGMACLAFSIFSLNAYLDDGKRYLYALPFVHLLWANSHTSIMLMFAPFGAFLGGYLVQRALGEKWSAPGPQLSGSRARTLFFLFLLSFCAALINPFGLSQFSLGGSYLVTDWYKRNIYELLPPEGTLRAALVAVDAAICCSFLLNWRRFPVIHALLVAPFLLLPFVSVRFAHLVALVGAPVMSRNISSFIADRAWGRAFDRTAMKGAAAVWIIVCSVLSLLNVGPFGLSYARFGPGFIEDYEPGKALAYMDRNGIDGRVMNSFYFGQYIIWKSYPGRTVFIDGRGYLTPDLLYKSQRFLWSNPLLDELERQYGFQSILVAYPEKYAGGAGSSDYDEGFSHPEWALVYWDDISLLYVKRTGKYRELVARDEYRLVKPDLLVTYFLRKHVTRENRDTVVAELRRNIRETGSGKANSILAALMTSAPGP